MAVSHLLLHQNWTPVGPGYTKIYQDIQNTKRRPGRPARPGRLLNKKMNADMLKKGPQGINLKNILIWL